MEDRSLNRAMDIFSALVAGKSISLKDKSTAELYNSFYADSEVYELTTRLLSGIGLRLYEHNDSLFATAGAGNKVFGYTNEDLRRMLGLRLNVELYLVFFIIYETITIFYSTSDSFQVRDYVRMDEVIETVTVELAKVLPVLSSETQPDDKAAENSFSAIALLWESLPPILNEDKDRNKASRGSRYGFTKLTFNFLTGQNLFVQVEDRFYPTDRFHAIAENYYEENSSLISERLEEIVNAEHKQD